MDPALAMNTTDYHWKKLATTQFAGSETVFRYVGTAKPQTLHHNTFESHRVFFRGNLSHVKFTWSFDFEVHSKLPASVFLSLSSSPHCLCRIS